MSNIKTGLTNNEFYCNPKYVVARKGNYNKKDKICSKWEYDETDYFDLNGNLAYELTFDSRNMKVIETPTVRDYTIPFYKAISAPLAMYRLICMFERMPTDRNNDWYKVVWNFPLKHKKTGERLYFGEWKGAFGFHSKYTSLNKVPASYLADLKEIVEFLVSDEVPHPYDSLVAGSVA